MTILVGHLLAAVPTTVSASSAQCYSRLENHWFCTSYLHDYRPELVHATTQHLWITLASVALGLVVALPLALIARRYRRLEATILGVSTGIYTIPSIALFPLIVPFTGAPTMYLPMLWPLLVSAIGYTLVFAAIVVARTRAAVMERRIRALLMARAEQAA